MKLTSRQVAIMKRVAKSVNGREMVSPDVAKQLAKKGLVRLTGYKYSRTEWNRKVTGSTLWEIQAI